MVGGGGVFRMRNLFHLCYHDSSELLKKERKKEERIRIQLDKVSRADGWERETFSIIKAERVVVDRSGFLLLFKKKKNIIS